MKAQHRYATVCVSLMFACVACNATLPGGRPNGGNENLGASSTQSILDLIAPLRLGMPAVDFDALCREPIGSESRIGELVEMANGAKVSHGMMTSPSSLEKLRIVRLPNGIIVGVGVRRDRIAFIQSSDARLRLPNGLGPGSTWRDVRAQIHKPTIKVILATCVRVKIAPTTWLVTPQWESHDLNDDTVLDTLEVWPDT
jgi:hypothetical protein